MMIVAAYFSAVANNDNNSHNGDNGEYGKTSPNYNDNGEYGESSQIILHYVPPEPPGKENQPEPMCVRIYTNTNTRFIQIQIYPMKTV